MPSLPGKSFQYMLTTAIPEINMGWIITEISDHLIIPLFTGYEINNIISDMNNIISLSFIHYQPTLVLRTILHSINL